MVASQYKPAELAKCEWEAVTQGPSWAVDSWGLGCMMQVGGLMICLSSRETRVIDCQVGQDIGDVW
jgi:hypothetical protein